MALTIQEALKDNRDGFYIGHRLILPFKCNVIKVIIENEIYTELVGSDHIKISQDSQNTSLYMRSAGRLNNQVGTYNVIKLVVADLDADLTLIENHVKLICEINDKHSVAIHAPDDNILFIE